MVRLFLSIISLLSIFVLSSCRDEKAHQEAVVPVTVTPVITEPVVVSLTWVGVLNGFQNADVRAQVTGYLLSQDYKEGSFVKKGDALFHIDPRSFEAALATANAEYARAIAQAQLAKTTEARQRELFEKKAVSSQDLDIATQNNQASLAAAAAAQAQVEIAKINLDHCTITAPFDGIVGNTLAQVGSLVGPGGSAAVLTQISQVDPIKAVFSITESQYLAVASHISELEKKSTTSAPPNNITITLANGKEYPQKGKYYFVNRQIESSTGTVSVETLFDNPEHILRPGLFVRVTIPVDEIKDALLVPQSALVEIQGSYMMSILDADNTVKSIRIEKGPVKGQNIVVTAPGLTEGMQVIVSGAEKVRPGMKVSPSPYTPLRPAAEETSTSQKEKAGEK